MKLSCDLYLQNNCGGLGSNQMSGLYWLCSNLGPHWEKNMLQSMENRLVELLREEIQMQKKYDGDYDSDVPEGTLVVSMSDMDVIGKYYDVDQQLQSLSQRKGEIKNLIKQCKYWDKPE